ncbi:hypothetical protein [Actinokineospora globicatena]|uniref:STAS domain-containing protein n=1 Tax=Actinokineospora globicatena TaxID=103729 RepID=A0A9W6V8L8_9PSEU|nr:hypothetical protein [Actinokineospora globicatena]GLW91099.1 hypothetical protein Aglo03_19150 [Actinokineospora globicatena]
MRGVEVSWALTGWAVVVRVAGEVGAVDVAAVDAELRAVCAACEPGAVVVLDLLDIALPSAHGARLISRFVAGCARGRARVCLVVDTGGAAYRVLRVAGVSERVPVFAGVREARAAVDRVVSGR